MKQTCRYWIGLAAGAFLLTSPVILGQQVTGVAFYEPASGRGAARQGAAQTKSRTDVLRSPVQVDLERVSLRSALDEIMRISGVRLFFSPVVVPLDRVVTVKQKDGTLASALEQALTGTQTTFTVTKAGQVVLVRQASPSVEIQDGYITGKVIQAKTKQPVSRAKVTVDGASVSATTEEDGSFRLSLPPGTYTIRIRALGFQYQSRQVTVQEEKSIFVDVALEHSTSVLDEVVVTGTVVATARRAIPTPITVITAEDIERRGITRIDQLLRGEVPGLIAVETGSQVYRQNANAGGDTLGSMIASTMFSRGASNIDGRANPVKTFVDGVELVDPSYIGALDPSRIERIEIITGPQAATIYGSGAMGGVMQIFTKKGSHGDRPDITLSLRYGMMQSNLSTSLTPTHRHAIGLTGAYGPGFSYAANGSYSYSGQWQPALYNRLLGFSLGATHQRNIRERGSLIVSASFGMTTGSNGANGAGTNRWGGGSVLERTLVESGEWPVMPTSWLFSQRIATSANQTVSLSVDYTPLPVWQHHLTLGRSQNQLGLVPEAPVFQAPRDSIYKTSTGTGDRVTFGYNTTIISRVGPMVSSSFTIGGTGSRGENMRVTGCAASKSATRYIPCDESDLGTTITVTKTVDDNSVGGFASWQLGFADHVFLTLGLRGEQNPAYGREHRIDWTPTQGLAVAMDFRDVTVKLLGSYGRATKPPSPDQKLAMMFNYAGQTPSQRIYQFESPHLRPEISKGPQGGIEVYFGNRGAFTINHYNQYISGLIQRLRVDSVLVTRLNPQPWEEPEYYYLQYQFLNTASIRQRGWEATGSATLAMFNVKGTYSWNDSRIDHVIVQNSWDAFAPGQTFPGVPSHMGNLTVAYAYHRTSITLVNNVVGAVVLEPYARASTYLGMRLKSYLDKAEKFRGSARWTKPGYVKSDLAANHRLTRNLSLMMNITNLGNSFGNDVGPLTPVLGRQTTLGVSVRFGGQ